MWHPVEGLKRVWSRVGASIDARFAAMTPLEQAAGKRAFGGRNSLLYWGAETVQVEVPRAPSCMGVGMLGLDFPVLSARSVGMTVTGETRDASTGTPAPRN